MYEVGTSICCTASDAEKLGIDLCTYFYTLPTPTNYLGTYLSKWLGGVVGSFEGQKKLMLGIKTETKMFFSLWIDFDFLWLLVRRRYVV